jgi:hypothetical protein
MASVTIQVTAVCAGGDHATVKLTKDGQSRSVQMLVPELRSAITQDDVEAFAKVALRMLSEGKTLVQFKTAAQTGFTVIV